MTLALCVPCWAVVAARRGILLLLLLLSHQVVVVQCSQNETSSSSSSNVDDVVVDGGGQCLIWGEPTRGGGVCQQQQQHHNESSSTSTPAAAATSITIPSRGHSSLLSTPATEASTTSSSLRLRDDDYYDDQNHKCTIYLAPSTIPHAGLGIFTTVPRKQGEFIGHGDVFLPLFEMDWHNDKSKVSNRQEDDESTTTTIHYFNPFSDYIWTGDTMGMSDEVESQDISAMCPGLDAAINCNMALINVGKAVPVWDDGGLHRSRDPGAGALTLYHNGTMPIVNRDIPAGGELFKFYGDAWFETRPDWFPTIPLSEDYPRAQGVLDAFGRLIGIGRQSKYHQQERSSSGSSSNDYDSMTNPASMRLSVDMQRELWQMIAVDSPFVPSSRTLNALPKKLEDAWIAIQDELAALHQPHAIRNETFLHEHGKCMDHIRPGRSTMTQAGRGAFAVRPLKNGTIVSGSPLLHLPHYQVFDMYEFRHNATTGMWHKGDTIIGQQLKLNYCFGHAESTLLLCPYGAGVNYINHNQSLANVRVQWSRHGLTSHNDTWLTLDPSAMEWIEKPNLALDYMALRDIQEGEELFMDYGHAFERAWQHHVATWKPLNDDSHLYASAHDFNLRMAQAPLRTEREQDVDPYPQNLDIRCHSALSSRDWRHRVFEHTSKYHHDDHRHHDQQPRHDIWIMDDKGYPCRILHRMVRDGVDLYDVQVQEKEAGEPTTEYTRSGVPRHAIAFSDKPYTTDMHLRNAFRFPIMIPDDIFPHAWRNAVPKSVY